MSTYFLDLFLIIGVIYVLKASLIFDFYVKESYIGVYLFSFILVKKYKYEDIDCLFIYDNEKFKSPSMNVFKTTSYFNRWFVSPVWLIMKDSYRGSKYITFTTKNDVDFVRKILKLAPHLHCINYE